MLTYNSPKLCQHIRLKPNNTVNERKVLQFTGCHANVGKTFTGLASSVMKVLQKAIAHKIYRENFCILSKIHENHKTFLSLSFYHLWYVGKTVADLGFWKGGFIF